jgi:hypothetical protein
MLELSAIFKKLRERLLPYSKEVKFTPAESDDIVRTIIMNADFAPIPVNERKVDSLLMTGYYQLTDNDSSHVYFQVKVVDWNSQPIFESDMIEISAKECPIDINLQIFKLISNPMKRGEIEYNSRIIKDFDNLFYHTKNNLLASPAQYRFLDEHPYAISWQLEKLKDILLRRYGITLGDTCSGSIQVVQSGSIIFSRDGKKYSRAGLVDGEALMPDSYPEESNKYHYFNTSVSATTDDVTMEKRAVRYLLHFRVEELLNEGNNEHVQDSLFSFTMHSSFFTI